MSRRGEDSLTARVSVRLRDGRVLSEAVKVVRSDAANPVSRQVLVDKLLSLTADVLGVEPSQAVVKTAGCLETLPDVRDLTSLLAGRKEA